MKKLLILTPLFIIGAYSSAQNLYVQPITGEQVSFAISERPTITFDNRTMTIQNRTFNLADVQNLSFVANVPVVPPPSSIETPLNDKQITVFPNPVQDELSIVVENPQGLSFRMFDMMGRLLKSDQIQTETTLVNMQNFAAGAYVLHIIQNGQTIQSFQIVKR